MHHLSIVSAALFQIFLLLERRLIFYFGFRESFQYIRGDRIFFVSRPPQNSLSRTNHRGNLRVIRYRR